MGALANAAALMKDEGFKDLTRAGIVYTATIIIAEPKTTPEYVSRVSLAKQALLDTEFVLGLVVSIMAGTPAIATSGDTAATVSEQAILDRLAQIWTTLATVIFPQ